MNKVQATSIPIEKIKIKDRLIKIDPEKVKEIADSIKEVGLINPITVCRVNGNYNLVSGLHRLEACKQLGWQEIECVVREYDSLDQELVEIDENLIKRGLTVLERAELLKKRKEIYEAKHQQTKAEEKRKANLKQYRSDTVSHRENIPAFTTDTANKTGLTPRTIQRDIVIASKITPEVKEVIKKTEIADSTIELLKLAKLEPEQQKEVAEKIVKGEAKKINKAINLIKIEKSKEAEYFDPPVISLESFETWLPKQPQCDLLLTDPPYSTEIEDVDAFVQSWLPLALSKVKDTGRVYIFIGAYPEELKAYLNCKLPTQILVWEYRNTIGPTPKFDYIQNWQAILYYRGEKTPAWENETILDLLAVQNVNASDGRTGIRWHTWEKPTELAKKIILQSTKPGDLILDPFAGTGTFILEAQALGRIGRGCDISEEMIKIAQTRGCKVE